MQWQPKGQHLEHRLKPYRWVMPHSFARCLGIGRIVFVGLHERSHVGGMNELHLMALLGEHPSPVVRGGTSFHNHPAGRRIGHKPRNVDFRGKHRQCPRIG